MKTALDLNLRYLTQWLDGRQVMVALTSDNSYAFVWSGGAYIDVCIWSNRDCAILEIDSKFYCYGEQNINVWDYENRKSEIEWLDKDEFITTILEWLV